MMTTVTLVLGWGCLGYGVARKRVLRGGYGSTTARLSEYFPLYDSGKPNATIFSACLR